MTQYPMEILEEHRSFENGLFRLKEFDLVGIGVEIDSASKNRKKIPLGDIPTG